MSDSPWIRMIETLITLAGLAALAWMEMPPSQRQMITLTARSAAHRALHRAARASGLRAMGRELAGRQHDADTGYRFTYRLSVTRDRL